MATVVEGCVFCNIVQNKKDQHLKTGENTVVIKDHSPHAPYHFLVLTKSHISKSNDLTVQDIGLVKEMEETGREYLREVLKEKGEADTVEAMLRTGFHKPPFLTVHHLHMHILYPVHDMAFIYRSVVFRPGRFFRLSKTVIEDLEKVKNQDGWTDLEKKIRRESSDC